MPWRGPQYPGELPTLGYAVLDWFEEYLVVPDGPLAGEPLVLTGEQAQFVLNLYTLDPRFRGPAVRGAALVSGRRVRRAILSRPKGWGKSPILAALCLCESLGDVVLDGWDADGEPVGRPWTSFGFKAKVQVIAVSEDQTANTWDPLLDMARNGPVLDAYDINPMETFVGLDNGRIEFVTSSATSREGGRPVFASLDQTESWTPTNGGVRLAAAVRRNLAKVNGCSVESPNAFAPGEKSVAEKSHEAAKLQAEGKLRGTSGGILLDHREAPPETDPTDRDSLMAGFSVAYGDSADVNGGWVNLERILEDYWDPDTEPQDARRYYLNQVTHASDSWLSQPEWAACVLRPIDGGTLPDPLADRDIITLGFDGSRVRAQGVTDATALIGCRVRDGHVFQIEVWEQPNDLPRGTEWRVPVNQVDAKVRETFARYTVVGMYADPAKWETHVAAWERDLGARLKVKSTRSNPIEWWMNRPTQVVQALAQFHGAVLDRELTHCGSSTLARHVLNARRRTSRSGIQIAKDHPDSPRKIDAAVAAVLAWQARLDALAAGAAKPSPRYAVGRLKVR